MTPVQLSEASRLFPELVERVLEKLALAKTDVTKEAIQWYLTECPEETEQPMDVGACADLMLTGQVPTRHGVAGRVGEHFACYCVGGSISAQPKCGG
jgi:hypothetical protein